VTFGVPDLDSGSDSPDPKLIGPSGSYYANELIRNIRKKCSLKGQKIVDELPIWKHIFPVATKMAR
jgi:hypothetical protein